MSLPPGIEGRGSYSYGGDVKNDDLWWPIESPEGGLAFMQKGLSLRHRH